MQRALVIAFSLAAASSCGDRRVTPPSTDAGRPRPKIDHPRSAVYSLPPHKIEPGRMGPYKLGETLASVLYAIPAGPGVEVLDILHVVRLSVIRVEEDRMMVGAVFPARASFVSVLAPEVARTESGVEVGQPRGALTESLGGPVTDPRHAVDPRLVAVAPIPGLRFVIENDLIAAAMLTDPPPPPPAGTEPPPDCAIDRSDDAAPALRGAFGGEPERIDCLTADEAVGAIGDDIVVVTTREKPRRLYSLHVAGLVFAGATHTGGKDEILAVARERNDKRAQWSVIAARWEAGRIVKALDEDAYELTAQSAGWIGAELVDLDLLLDLEARSDTIIVSGVLLGRGGAAIRLAVPLEPISVTRRKRPAVEGGTAGTGDASVQPLGDAAPPADSATR